MQATTERSLTAHDRCDRCNARATSWIELKSGSDLMFCLHHHNQFWPALQAADAKILTFSAWLDEG